MHRYDITFFRSNEDRASTAEVSESPGRMAQGESEETAP